jgi:hypothetical protein
LPLPQLPDELSASLNPLDNLFRAWVGFYWPTKLIAAGIVNEADFNKLVAQINRELKDNEEKARENETEIIKVARELGIGIFGIAILYGAPALADVYEGFIGRGVAHRAIVASICLLPPPLLMGATILEYPQVKRSTVPPGWDGEV